MPTATKTRTRSRHGTNGKARGGLRLRNDFPVLRRRPDRRPLVYLDNAGTTQKPRAVIDRLRDFYAGEYAKTQTEHALGRKATEAYEEVRAKAAEFLNAGDEKQVVLVRGTTDAINLVATAFGQAVLGSDDEVVVTRMEHHANIIPWQMACERSGAELRVAPVDEAGDLMLDELEALLTRRTKLVALAHASNVLGTVYPIKEAVRLAHAHGVPVLVDGAQAAPHLPVDVQDLGCDFYALSAHKLYGPTGVGVLYGRRKWLRELPPTRGGASMAKSVSFEGTEYEAPPKKFEAGVPAIAEVIGFGAALDYLREVGMARVATHEVELSRYAAERLREVDRVHLLGTSGDRLPIFSFTVEGLKAQEVAEFLDKEAGIAVHSGKLNAEPLLEFLGVPGAVRASFALYNTREEADALAEALAECVEARG